MFVNLRFIKKNRMGKNFSKYAYTNFDTNNDKIRIIQKAKSLVPPRIISIDQRINDWKGRYTSYNYQNCIRRNTAVLKQLHIQLRNWHYMKTCIELHLTYYHIKEQEFSRVQLHVIYSLMHKVRRRFKLHRPVYKKTLFKISENETLGSIWE